MNVIIALQSGNTKSFVVYTHTTGEQFMSESVFDNLDDDILSCKTDLMRHLFANYDSICFLAIVSRTDYIDIQRDVGRALCATELKQIANKAVLIRWRKHKLTKRKLSVLSYYESLTANSQRKHMAKSERRSKATIFFNMYRVKHIVRYDEQTICKDGTIIEPWHHVVITKNNTAVIYVWDTRKVEHVIDAHNLVGTPVLAKEFDNYEPLIGYGKTDKHVNAEDLLS